MREEPCAASGHSQCCVACLARGERGKWIQLIEAVTATVFVLFDPVAGSGCQQVKRMLWWKERSREGSVSL